MDHEVRAVVNYIRDGDRQSRITELDSGPSYRVGVADCNICKKISSLNIVLEAKSHV